MGLECREDRGLMRPDKTWAVMGDWLDMERTQGMWKNGHRRT